MSMNIIVFLYIVCDVYKILCVVKIMAYGLGQWFSNFLDLKSLYT